MSAGIRCGGRRMELCGIVSIFRGGYYVPVRPRRGMWCARDRGVVARTSVLSCSITGVRIVLDNPAIVIDEFEIYSDECVACVVVQLFARVAFTGVQISCKGRPARALFGT